MNTSVRTDDSRRFPTIFFYILSFLFFLRFFVLAQKNTRVFCTQTYMYNKKYTHVHLCAYMHIIDVRARGKTVLLNTSDVAGTPGRIYSLRKLYYSGRPGSGPWKIKTVGTQGVFLAGFSLFLFRFCFLFFFFFVLFYVRLPFPLQHISIYRRAAVSTRTSVYTQYTFVIRRGRSETEQKKKNRKK